MRDKLARKQVGIREWGESHHGVALNRIHVPRPTLAEQIEAIKDYLNIDIKEIESHIIAEKRGKNELA